MSINLDAAYGSIFYFFKFQAGPSWFIPEYRDKVKGLEKVDTIQINFSKIMMCGMTSALLYVKNKKE